MRAVYANTSKLQSWRNYEQYEIRECCYISAQNILSSFLSSQNIKIKIQWTVILRVILYGCESWSGTGRLRGEHRLKVLKNRILKKIFGPKRYEVTGEWRRLHNKALKDLYSSPDITQIIKSKRMWWMGNVACMWERRGVLVWKPEGKRPLWRLRHRWEDNINMVLQ
jgi:hypothetical protein